MKIPVAALWLALAASQGAVAENGYKGLPWGSSVAEIQASLGTTDATDPVTPTPPFHAIGEALLFFDENDFAKLYDYGAFPVAFLNAELGTGAGPDAHTSLTKIGGPVYWMVDGGLVGVTLTFTDGGALTQLTAQLGEAQPQWLELVGLWPYDFRYGALPRHVRPPTLRWSPSGTSVEFAAWSDGDRIVVWDQRSDGIEQVTYLQPAWYRAVEKRALDALHERETADPGQLKQLD